MLQGRTLCYGCLVLGCLFWTVASAPQPIDIAAKVRQGSGAFIVLECMILSECSDTAFLITALPTKGQIFRARGFPHQPASTFERSDLIQSTGVQLSNRIVYYLPFHEVFNAALNGNMLESDTFSFRAGIGSSEARCLIEISSQQLLPIGGGSGYSLLFDGIDDITVTPVDSWFPTEAFTFMLWIRVYDRTKQATILSYFGDQAPVFEISNPLNLTCVIGFLPLSPSNIDVSDGEWHHIAATWSSSSMTCKIIVDGSLQAVAIASSGLQNLKKSGTIVLGNRQACDMLDPSEIRARDTQSKASKTIIVTPEAENDAFTFSAKPSTLLMQHVANRAHAFSTPAVSVGDTSPLQGDPYINSRQRSDYLLCRCTGGCFHQSLAFAGEMDDLRLYSFEKTIPEIRVESKFVFIQKESKSQQLNKTRPQLDQQFHGLQLWMTFDVINGSLIADDSGQNRSSYRGSSATQRFPCHKKREPFHIVSSTGVLGGLFCAKSINAASRIEVKLPGVVGIGNRNETLLPFFRFNKKQGGGQFYHAACGYSGILAASMLALGNSLVGPTGCIIYVPNQVSTMVDVIEYSISNVAFPTEQETDPAYIDFSYSISFFRESNVIPSNYLVGLQADKISVVKLLMTRPDSSRLSAAIHGLPQNANLWIAIEARCADIQQCQPPINTLSWETSGSSFIDSSSFLNFSYWKYVRPPFASNLHQAGPSICGTDQYFTPEPTLPSKVCKIGKYFLNDTIFYRPNQGDPLYLEFSKWNWIMWEMSDFSRLPYGGLNVNNTLQGVIVECLVYAGSNEVPLDNCTCCYISNCFPPYGRILPQSALPSTPAAVLRAVLQQNIDKLDSLLIIGAPFDRSAINAAAALGSIEILTKLFGRISLRWDYDAIELASNFGFPAVVNFLKSRTGMQGYEGKRTGAKCLVRGDNAASFTGFVTSTPYFLASGVRGALGQLGSLTIRWSKAQFTDVLPNYPVSRLQNVSFFGMPSSAPKPDDKQLLKSVFSQGFQNEPLVMQTSTSTSEFSRQTCQRFFIDQHPEHGHVYNLDDSFDFQRCKLLAKDQSFSLNDVTCREFGMGVYFFNVGLNQSTFLNTPPRPIVYPSRILNPVFEPVSGVKIAKNQEFISQLPLGILNASSNNVTGPRFGKDGGREDLVLLDNLSWDNNLDYGNIGSLRNSSFQSFCGTLGYESVAFRFAKKVFPSHFSFLAVIESSTKVRISAKAPPKRLQTRNFVQSDTPSSRLVSTRVFRNISAFEFEIQGTRFMKPEVQSLWSWQYVTGDSDGAWVTLWDGIAADMGVRDEPMKHKATFCHDAGFSWLETDTILVEVCGLKNLGTSFSDPGPQLSGVANAQLNGTRGGSPRGLIQSLKSKLVYMPKKMQSGQDYFSYAMKDWSNGLSSNSERVSVNTIKRPLSVAAAHIETVVPFNHSAIVTLIGFAFNEPLDSFLISSMPSKLLLKQFDGSLLGFPRTSNDTNIPTTQLLISDSEHRLQVEVPDIAAGFFYDSFEYSVGVLGSNARDVAKITVHVLCRSATYYNSSLRQCLPCPPGTFNTKMALSSSCENCPPGTESKSGSTECTPCLRGYFAPKGALCSKCLPGTYSPEPGLQRCVDCPKGNFSSTSAATSCRECGNLAYADETKSLDCKSCPKLTASNSKTSTSISECKCVEGSYEPKGQVGKECLLCPDGAHCHGNRHPPVTKRHFWTSQTEWTSIEEPYFFICDHRGVRNVCQGFPEFNRGELTARCAHRSVPGLCDYFPFIPISIFGNSSAIDDRSCSKGYTGRICSSCIEGFYNYPGGSCRQCPSAILVLLTAAVVTSCFFVIAAASASPVISIYISSSNLQNLALLSQFGIPHAPALAEIWSALAVFNTNFELIPFQCIMGSAFDWAAVWNLEVLTVSLILAVCVGRWMVPYFMYRPLLNTHANRSMKQRRPTSAIPVNRHGSYRPSRPSTPSSQQSDHADKPPIKNSTSITNLVVVDVTDGAPNIDADVFEDDSESAIIDSVNLANFRPQVGNVRRAPDIQHAAAKVQMARTGLVSAHSTVSSAASSVDLEQWHGLSQDELDFYFDSAVWIACFLLEYFFYFGSLATFRAYACRSWKSSTLVLVANPNIVCGDSLHNSMVGISIPMFFLNVALLPCATLAVLIFGSKKNLLQNPKFMQRWGFLFERYEQEYYWWQMVVICRKFLLTLIATFLFSDPYLQLTLSCIVLSINVVLNLAARPFRYEQHGTFDSLLMLLTISSFSLSLVNPTDIIKLNYIDESQERGILCAQLIVIGIFFAICMHYIADELRHTEYDLPTWIMRIKSSTLDLVLQKASKFHQFTQEIISKKMDAKRTVIAESNIVRLSRIQSAVRKDVERAHFKNEKRDSAQEIKLSEWNRHLTDADVEIRRWDTGNVLTEKVSWRTSKFDMRKRIVVLERLLREEALHDSKSPKILNLEREITTALKISLQALKTENEVIYESLYDTEAECEALEKEKTALEAGLAVKERKISETTEKNAFLTTRSNLKVLGLSDESEWKEKLKLEESLRRQLEENLLQLQLKMSKFSTEL